MTSWNTEERAGLGNTAGYIQRLISAPLNCNSPMGSPGAEKFDLYYFRPDFSHNSTAFKKLDKTILFCLGGPGRVLKPHDNIWFKKLSLNGYKIVYFHLRGSGFSQLPDSNVYDQYIRTEYAADDIEKIREDVFGKNNLKAWDAVIGYSYGAVLAQQYASKYSAAVSKLILIGPISLHKFVDSADPIEVYNEYEQEVKKIRISIIDEIYKLKIFGQELTISDAQKVDIKNQLFAEEQGVFKKIDMNFGSEQSVIDNFEILSRNSTQRSLLETVGLNYERRFFEALRELHLYGRRTDNDGAVNQEAKLAELGEVIARALGVLGKTRGRQDAAAITNAPRSKRVFEVMGVYDGINKRFIREWFLNGKKDVAKCLERSSGSAWNRIPGYKRAIGIRVGTEEIAIKRWSPADHPHSKSTLILKGSADPVTAAGQAESYLNYVDQHSSILLNFDGVGHEFILPGVNVESNEIHEMLRGSNADPLNCLIYAFVEKPWDEFKRVAQPIWNALEAEEHLPVATVKPGR